MSKYVIFTGPYFPVFGPQKTPYWDTLHAVHLLKKKQSRGCKVLRQKKLKGIIRQNEGNYQTRWP